MTEPRYRSKQAATTQDPFVAVYGADVKFAEAASTPCSR